MLALLIVAVGMIVSAPRDAFAATAMTAACNANLRTGPSTSDSIQTTVQMGGEVGVIAVVNGGSWSANCPSAVSGSQWYEITEINGQSVSALYGLGFLYGAIGLFTTATATPVPSASATPTPTAFPTPTPLPTPTPTPTFATPTPTPGVPTPSPSPTPTPTPIPTLGPTLNGIDVSHWQGAIDWPSVAAAGMKFAFIKASEGTTLADDYYLTNRAGANGAGMFIGAYHFARPSSDPTDAVAEADHFVDTARPAPGDVLPVLDLEDSGNLSVADLQSWVAGFLGEVYARTGVHALIYVSPNFWKNHMGDTTWFALNGYPMLWIAHWTTSTAPTVPATNWGGYGWTFWQYTSNGQVPGISGRVDLDRFNGLDLTPALIPGNAAIPTQQTPSLSLVSTPLVTNYKSTVTSVAQLEPLGTSRALSLQRLGPTDAGWVTVANGTTDSSGTVRYSTPAGYSAQYRASWVGAPDLAGANSTSTSIAVRYAVRLPAGGTTRTVGRGTRITYTATERPLTPNGLGRISFLIYRRVNGSWVYRTAATVAVDPTGLATFSWRWTQTGDWYIRARANTTAYNTASLSPIAVVKVR